MLSCLFCSLWIQSHLSRDLCYKISLSLCLCLQSQDALSSRHTNGLGPHFMLFGWIISDPCVSYGCWNPIFRLTSQEQNYKRSKFLHFFPRFLFLESSFNFLHLWYGFKAILIFAILSLQDTCFSNIKTRNTNILKLISVSSSISPKGREKFWKKSHVYYWTNYISRVTIFQWIVKLRGYHGQYGFIQAFLQTKRTLQMA